MADNLFAILSSGLWLTFHRVAPSKAITMTNPAPIQTLLDVSGISNIPHKP
jgi:hypothetical protein